MRVSSMAFVFCLAAGPALAVPMEWSVADGGNGHFYDVIDAPDVSISSALAATATTTHNGWTGYLATITSAGESSFLRTLVGNAGSNGAYFAASDAETEGVWKWIAGPEFGQALTYFDWTPGEGNSDLEDHVEIDTNGWSDRWGGTTADNYVVEYSAPAAIPLPATGWALVGALGALAALRRRPRPVS